MRILAFSDICSWKGYKELVERIQPDVVVLAGDLTSDGFVSYKFGYPILDKYRETARKEHVTKFYQFLRYAGHRSKVVVVKGNHDEEFEDAYVPGKISRISGCKEISGKTIDIEGLRLLGLGFRDTYYLKVLRSIIQEFKEKVDVVIMHGIRIRLVSQLRPIIIIRGGYIDGKFLVHDVPSVWNGFLTYTILELEDRRISQILQFKIGSDEPLQVRENYNRRLEAQLGRYEWLKPYLS